MCLSFPTTTKLVTKISGSASTINQSQPLYFMGHAKKWSKGIG